MSPRHVAQLVLAAVRAAFPVAVFTRRDCHAALVW
jgi:hypothetical protein